MPSFSISYWSQFIFLVSSVNGTAYSYIFLHQFFNISILQNEIVYQFIIRWLDLPYKVNFFYGTLINIGPISLAEFKQHFNFQKKTLLKKHGRGKGELREIPVK